MLNKIADNRVPLAIWIQPAPIPELIPAEGTVVKWTTNQPERAAQRIRSYTVNSVHLAPYLEVMGMANRALGPAFEDGDRGSVEMRIGAAVIAVK
jgi:hypothetical protein